MQRRSLCFHVIYLCNISYKQMIHECHHRHVSLLSRDWRNKDLAYQDAENPTKRTISVLISCLLNEWQMFDRVGWENFDRPQGEPTQPTEKERRREEGETKKEKRERERRGEERVMVSWQICFTFTRLSNNTVPFSMFPCLLCFPFSVCLCIF